MNLTRREYLASLAGGLLPSIAVGHAETEKGFSDAEKEKFLTSGKIISTKEIGHGVTKPVQVELEYGGATHAAKIQGIDKVLPRFFAEDGTTVPMKDSWRYNIAAYKIDRLLDMNMVTVAVRRPYKGKTSSFSWWVDNVMFEEVERLKKKIEPPDPETFDRQRQITSVFDELIINIDRNASNLLITKDWKIALIDHSRAFNAYHGIRNKANLNRCSRRLLAKMRELTPAMLKDAAGEYLTPAELGAVLARRDQIVAFFEKRLKDDGEEKVLFG